MENKNLLHKYDSGQVLASIKQLPQQCRQAQREVRKIKWPASYFSVRNIVVCGMGGSALGSDLIKNIYSDRLNLPLSIVSDYNLPKFVNQDTLVIASSYSGNTEEVLAATEAAFKKGSKIFVISAGGHLAEWAIKHHLPAYIFKPFFNPSGQPRLGLGYSVIGQIEILKQLKILNVTEEEVDKAVSFLEKSIQSFKETIRQNLAVKTASQLTGKIPIIFASNYLTGNAHIFANQLHENAKNFACYFSLPELNHHLLEGLSHPSLASHFVFLLLKSDFDPPSLKKRFTVTQNILTKKSLKNIAITLSGNSRLSQALWFLAFGSFTSFYLAQINHEDPVFIPWVDYLKKQLAKR